MASSSSSSSSSPAKGASSNRNNNGKPRRRPLSSSSSSHHWKRWLTTNIFSSSSPTWQSSLPLSSAQSSPSASAPSSSSLAAHHDFTNYPTSNDTVDNTATAKLAMAAAAVGATQRATTVTTTTTTACCGTTRSKTTRREATAAAGQQQQSSHDWQTRMLSSLAATNTTTAEADDKDDCCCCPTYYTIDQAMTALYHCNYLDNNVAYVGKEWNCRQPPPTILQLSNSHHDDDDENESSFDWILDGHVSFAAEEERSRQLLSVLYGNGKSSSSYSGSTSSGHDDVVVLDKDKDDGTKDDYFGHDNTDIHTRVVEDHGDDDESSSFGDFQTADAIIAANELSSSSSSNHDAHARAASASSKRGAGAQSRATAADAAAAAAACDLSSSSSKMGNYHQKSSHSCCTSGGGSTSSSHDVADRSHNHEENEQQGQDAMRNEKCHCQSKEESSPSLSVPREVVGSSVVIEPDEVTSVLHDESDDDGTNHSDKALQRTRRQRARRARLYSSLLSEAPMQRSYITDHVSSPEGRFARRQYHASSSCSNSNKDDDDDDNDEQSLFALPPPPTTTAAALSTTVSSSPQHVDVCNNMQGHESLPEHYFSNPDWDPTLDLLRSMPWHHVVLLQQTNATITQRGPPQDEARPRQQVAAGAESTDSDDNHDNDPTMQLQEYITQRLSQVDASLAKVHSMLLKRALQKSHLLSNGNAVVHEMHHNVSMAAMYLERSKESIARARNGDDDNNKQSAATATTMDQQSSQWAGIEGAVRLLNEFNKRDDYAQLQKLLSTVDGLLEREGELMDYIRSFGKDPTISHDTILERARQLYQTAHHHVDLSRLTCLNELRERTSQVLATFQSEIEECLCAYIDGLCHNWSLCSDTEYERLFRALVAVEEARRLEASSGCGIETSRRVDGVAQIWSKCIAETLCFQADKCFARALLDPTDNADSEFDKELIHLGFEMRQGSRDAVKLVSLTHNLVTIRFDFEVNCNYLPVVYHQLCAMLTEVLHAHHILSQLHEALLQQTGNGDKATARDPLEEIDRAIRYTKVDIWSRCEQVLMKCLDQYHHFAAKKTLFPRDRVDDGTMWLEDLEGLNDVLRLTKQFLSLGCEFLDADQMESIQILSFVDHNSKGELREKLCDVFRKHLRAMHVEAMTSLGASLFHESWRLVPPSIRGTVPEPPSNDQDKLQLVHTHLMGMVEECSTSVAGMKVRYSQNGMSLRTNGDSSILQAIKSRGNPFLCLTKTPSRNSHVSFHRVQSRNGPQFGANNTANTISGENEKANSLFTTLCGLCDDDQFVIPAIATESVNNVLMKWNNRLLSVMLQLPLVADDVTKIFRDLCDLYFITAFRLCAGNAKNERIILGIDPPSPIDAQDVLDRGLRGPPTRAKKESPGFMGFGIRPSNSDVGHHRRGSYRGSGSPTAVSESVEAELCAPLPSDAGVVSRLRDFIMAGQENLESVVKLGKLEQRMRDPIPPSAIDGDFIDELVHVLKKRQAAAWSCLLVAASLDVTCWYAEQVVTGSFLDDLIGVNGNQATAEAEESVPILNSLAAYSNTASQIAPHMVKLCSQVACAHAILGKTMVKEVISAGSIWEESRLNEHSNPYVDVASERYALIWHSLSSPPPTLPRGVLRIAWEHICEAGFLALLDGFSRVPCCSTEGRSLMSMDLASFNAGIDVYSVVERLGADESFSVPPRVSPKRGIRYVDMYVKVFYYPEEDVMKWIVSNFANYHLNHVLALLTCGAKGRETDNIDVKKLIDSVQALYSDSPSSGQGSGQRQE